MTSLALHAPTRGPRATALQMVREGYRYREISRQTGIGEDILTGLVQRYHVVRESWRARKPCAERAASKAGCTCLYCEAHRVVERELSAERSREYEEAMSTYDPAITAWRCQDCDHLLVATMLEDCPHGHVPPWRE